MDQGRGRGRGGRGRGDGGRGGGRGGGGRDGGRGGRDGGRGGGRDGGRRGGGGGRGRGGGGQISVLAAGEGAKRNISILSDPNALIKAGQRPASNYRQLSSIEQKNLGLSREDVQLLQNYGFPSRPGKGRVGRATKVIVNLFQMTTAIKMVYHHDVQIYDQTMFEVVRKAREENQEEVPESNLALPRKGCVKILDKLSRDQQWPPGWVYDGRKNIFAASLLLNTKNQGYWEDFQVVIANEDGTQQKPFVVVIRYTSEVPMDQIIPYIQKTVQKMPENSIQALEIAFNHPSMMSMDCVRIGRGIFYEPNPQDIERLGYGLGMWIGYKQAVNICETGLALNVDMAGGIFVKEMPVMQYIAEVLNLRDGAPPRNLNERQQREVKKALSDLKINMTHRFYERANGSKKYAQGTITGLAPPPPNARFKLQDGRNTTVQQYFRENYPQIDISSSLGLPCLKLKGGSLPMSCAIIQTQQRRSNIIEQAKSMIPRVMAKPPAQRLKQIQQKVRDVITKEIAERHLQPFKLNVSPNPLQVSARILPTPKLVYGGDKQVDVGQEGAWNLRDLQFLRAQRVESWALVCMLQEQDVNYDGGLPDFLRVLVRSMKGMGMNVPEQLPSAVYLQQQRMSSDKQQMYQVALSMCKDGAQRAQKQYGKKCQLILVLMPFQQTDLYNAIKKATISSSGVGIPSQCFVADKCGIGRRTRSRISEDYCSNLSMKINAKLGGTTVALAGGNKAFPLIGDKPFMIMGADLSHPGPGSKDQKSIASLVGSVDMNGQRYVSTMRPQGHRVQMIEQIGPMVSQLLKQFFQINQGRKPERLILFRGGVSDGQQTQVLENEYIAIRKAIQGLGQPDYAPPITFVVVNQNHSVRMFPQQGGESVGKMMNVMPGTIVDSGVTHPHNFDFYLVSHQGIQGTSRPAHYTVLLDENYFGPDGIQLMCYWMCYTFCRCPRAVSVVPPIYYATEVCKKGVAIQQREEVSDTDSSVGGLEEVIQQFSNQLPAMFFV